MTAILESINYFFMLPSFFYEQEIIVDIMHKLFGGISGEIN